MSTEQVVRTEGIGRGARLVDAVPTGLFVAGGWREASDGATIDVIDPATEATLTSVASASEADAVVAVGAAEASLGEWGRTAPRRRSEILRRAFDLMTERIDDLALLISMENGKALADSVAEVRYAAEFFRWYAEEAVRLSGSIQPAPSGDYRIVVEHQPVGVAVLVTPWNFPAAMATRKIGPALAAGCTVVLKPASDTPLTALALAGLLREAGVPDGVVNVLPAHRSGAVVRTLLDQPAVRKVSFTGSTEVGISVLHAAADRVLSSSMELGGNAPFLVLADADLDAAVAGAMAAKMRNGGEACTAANRFYVHESVADEFGARFAAAMAKLRVGPGYADGVDLGPLVNAAARTKVHQLVQDALARGARARTGGRAPEAAGYYFEPTVLDDVAGDAEILGQEIFGPVAPIVRFTHLDEAIESANATEFGLVSYIYTADLAEGMRTAEALQTGMVGLNRGVVSDPSAPFGGIKHSGLGREGGHDGMLEYTERKYIATSW
ncbi:NAD-dependent succinate-semialdehyde dehydrogenase [Actinobacteria bacterium YIM 96077]|uniref:NAD-dependent succinate-semialdehyde dehydrogenase n=1 Tax=Phytoactinopolyspora halophila TaxID=1981511 RepID=A0A329QYM8_9ACTN|nr:NAD-dependent succinate-semialdehyde dehydrogenase [Phytoactinopolyspora halophila]AYY13340.1 NAD-dependent succinate-semialdehyde dehydrogenase [Actinobacteria bacterium YIM 96077]RAW17425.1 NAD-dependent succinate-semialdehyde dehydrogenase [Phytoactinopolyspora halophila]